MKIEQLSLRQDRADVTLTAYIQDARAGEQGERCRPAVLICPGGAYCFCADTESEPVALRFCAMGFNAFVVRYATVYGSGVERIEGPVMYERRWYPTALLDVARAMRAIVDRAHPWQVDVAHIAIAGFSAGGHMAALFATRWHEPGLWRAAELHGGPVRPTAAILGYMVGDECFQSDDTDCEGVRSSERVRHVMKRALAGDDPGRDVLRDLMPARLVGPQTPPAFLWGTASDATISPINILSMAQALAHQEIPFELHVFAEGPHGLSLASRESASSDEMIRSEVAVWVSLAECWLENRGVLV